MIDIAKILSSPNRDDEIRKLIVPKPWKHKVVGYICTRCKMNSGYIYSDKKPSCTVPDPTPLLDWSLAMKMRDEAVKPAKLAFFLEEVCRAENRMDYQFALWLVWEAQPHHYILAAILAGEE